MATAALKNVEPQTSADRVKDFRARHGLTSDQLDELLGYGSNGRATRGWEAKGAPPYVETLLSYLDKFGLREARRLAELRKQNS